MLAGESVSRYMTSAVLSIDVDSPAGEVLRLFAGYPVHHLPVLRGAKVVGMISSADVLKIEAFLPKHPSGDPTEYLNQRIRVDKIMRQPAITIRDDETVERAAQLMAENGIHALPVTTAEQDLIGIITSTDIMHVALFPARYGSTRHAEESEAASRAARLSPAQMLEALQLAATATEAGDDRSKLARGLLQTQMRLKPLEEVLQAADRYLRGGQDEHLHSALVKAIDRARAV